MKWLIPVILFVLVLGCFTYLSVPRGRCRIAAVGTFIALVAVIFAGTFSLLGKPKPIALEFRHIAGSQIVGMVLKEGEAIYLWVAIDGEPVTLVLPWSTKDAQNIQDAIKSAKEGGGTVKLTRRIDGLPDAPANGEISEVVPPEALPEKTQE